MKTITIGRGDGCNIYIDDESMSRRHAIIKIPTFGEMEIVDMSKNGTSVNGIRLRPNVPFPVSRKDVVTFADVAQLDWAKVPDPLKYYKLGALIVGGLIVLLLAIFLVKNLFSDSTPQLLLNNHLNQNRKHLLKQRRKVKLLLLPHQNLKSLQKNKTMRLLTSEGLLARIVRSVKPPSVLVSRKLKNSRSRRSKSKRNSRKSSRSRKTASSLLKAILPRKNINQK